MSNFSFSTIPGSGWTLGKSNLDLTYKFSNFEWKGQKQPHPFDDAPYVSLDPSLIPSCYNLCISGVTPRPIAFVSSQSVKGINNLSPFSYFGLMAHDPPTISIGICKNRNGKLN